MKKLILALLMVLSLIVFVPAQAAVETLANFTFDSEANYANGGNAKAVVSSGTRAWVDEYKGKEGVMYFDGNSSLNIVKNDDTSLLANCTYITVSFDYYNAGTFNDWDLNDWIFTAYDPNGNAGNMYYGTYIGTSVRNTAVRAECPKNGNVVNSSDYTVVATDISSNEWHHVEIHYTSSGMTLYVDGQLIGTNTNIPDLTEVLGAAPAVMLGKGPSGENFNGYVDNLQIKGEKSIRAALNPFNNLGNDRPNLYDGLTLKAQGSDSSLERIVFPVAEGAKITLPCEDSLRDGFTLGDKTYILEGTQANPRKLIGWYNIADGKYYSVLTGDATNVALTGKNDVFYGDWIASSYDFLGTDTKPDDLITTADTSSFIDINVFDYSDLVNVNSMTVSQSGVGSESWSVYDNRENGWLAFSDYGTYRSGGSSDGSIGFPHNRDNTVHGYNGADAKPGVLAPADKIISTMFNQNSKPGAAGYVPGINYLGKGNYLFKYDPATGMYSYDCETNAAVYQQDSDPSGDDEGRFYVYKTPFDYHSTDENNNNIVCHDFFPLNAKPDNDKFKLDKSNGVPNYWFGMDFTMDFWLPDNSGSGGNQITNAKGDNVPMIFEFEGDDDMWVLIDGKLVLDIGGIHDPVEGTINFSTGLIEVFRYDKNGNKIINYSNKDDLENADKPLFTAGDHTMQIYYLERGGDKSNCTIKFNLLPEYEVEEPGVDTVQVSKDWVGTPNKEMPPTITVELYDANKGKDSPAIKTATFGIDELGKWAHSFSNLPHTDKDNNVIKYAIREVGLPQTSVDDKPFFDVDIATKVTTYSNAWVFTDQAGLKNEKNVVIGNGRGEVLGVDLNAHAVTEMDEKNNIIVKLTDGNATPLLWQVEPAAGYTGGKHFYLKNGENYLCIKLPDSAKGTSAELHLHGSDDATQPSIFYLNASGDLQDATTGHRLIATDHGFAVDTNVGGNITTESANKASLYVMRTSETTAYTFNITNTYVDPSVPTGTLKISKTTSGNADKDTDEFIFLVTLADKEGKAVSGTFGGYEFNNGRGLVALTNGKSATLLLPEGTHYTVTEQDANGYELITPSNNKYEGDIVQNATLECPFHNEKNRYSLIVNKFVTGNAADEKRPFVFTVTLTDADDKPLSGTFGNYDFGTGGKFFISIAHGETFTIPDLPLGTKYTISEANCEYSITSPVLNDGKYSGTITTGENKVEFVNELNLYSLTVSKTVKGNAADATKDFAFTVALTDADGKALTGTFGEHTFYENGKAVISIAHGESFTITGLPEGTRYAVSEASDGYTQTAPTEKEITGTITTGENKVDFTNVLDVVRLVKVTEPTGLTVAPNVTVTGSDGSVVTTALTANDDASYLEIPVKPGVTYTVAESGQDIAGYAFTGSSLTTMDAEVTVSGMTFAVAKNSLTTIPVLTLTNTYAQGGLTISKTVKGNAASNEDSFLFTVSLTNADGKAVSGTFGEHTFTDGKATITLKGGQSVTIQDLPIGATYTVTETPAEGYVQTAPAAPATGVISTEAASVSFTNERWAVDIQKKAVGLASGTSVAPKVTVGDVFSGELLSGGDAERIYLTPGKTYAVAEENAEVAGYTLVSALLSGEGSGLTVTDMDFVLANTSTEIPVLTLTNTYAQGGLTISKTVKGNAADVNDEFLFTVSLTDADGKAVSGTFGEHTFTDGKATITLKGGQSVTIDDLPIGVSYTVTEAPAAGYVQTAPTAPATGVISTEAASVAFTNVRWAVDIQKKAVGLIGADTVAPKVTVGDVVIDALPAGDDAERIYLTPGKTYAIAEENAEVAGYTLVSALLSGEGSGLTVNGMDFVLADTSTEIPVLTLTNTYTQGGLTVSKTVKGNAASNEDSFLFTVELTDADGKAVSGTFGEHTFTDGKATITLKGGQSVTIEDLPIGVTYTVTETPAAGYVQTAPTKPATGVISTTPAVVSFTNVRDVVRLVKVTDPANLTVAPKVTVIGSDGSVVTAEALTANNAAKYLEIPVKPDVTYTVAESGQDIAGYAFTGSSLTAKDAEVTVAGMTFTVAKNGLTTIPVLTLTNTYAQNAVTLTIRKVSTGLEEGIAYPAPKVSIFAADSTAPVWTGTLTPNGSALPVKLLPGQYTVKEVIDEVKDHSFTSVLYVNGAASADNTFTLAANAVNTELRLENVYAAEFSTLTLTKTVTGESGDKTAFSFRITLTDEAGKALTQRFPYTGTLDGSSPISGVITSGSTVALRDGGSITVKLPLGVRYAVEEQGQAGYVLVSSEGEKGVITKAGAKAAFVNKPQYTVTVTKVWEGDTADVRPASVQVQLMLNGKPMGAPVTLSAANGWKHTYTGLNAKGPYTVDELTVTEGYVSTVEEGEDNTFVITNSYIVIPPTGDAAHPALYLLTLVGSAALLMLLRKKRTA